MKISLDQINNLINILDKYSNRKLVFVARNKKEFDYAKKLFPNNVEVILQKAVKNV
jgi:hypothetical protein